MVNKEKKRLLNSRTLDTDTKLKLRSRESSVISGLQGPSYEETCTVVLRILPFTFMRIRIRILPINLMRIHADPDPQHLKKVWKSWA